MRFRLFAAFIILVNAVAVWGQATTSLRGTIRDAQGTAIDTANVGLLRTETGLHRNVLTDTTGSYQFAQMPPGSYTITVQKPGFAILTQRGVDLQVGTPATLNLVLEVASVSETVNVEAEVASINTVDAAIGNAFNQSQVRALPLQTRNVVELLSLQPGVTPTGEVLGSRRDQNNIILDGADVNDNQNSGLGGLGTKTNTALPGFNANGLDRNSGFNSVLPVPLDSVQEFRVTVGGEGANQGRSSGGQVTLITKSGGNQFHGSGYEYNRNTLFSANDWFNNRAGVPRQTLNRNQFGASLGGRFIKDRVFFFLNYEERIDSSAISQLSKVPSETLKQGILTLTTNDGVPRSLTPAQLKQIDPQGLGVSPAILSILQKYPVGNDLHAGFDGGLNFAGFRFNAPNGLTNRAWVGKMDFHIDQAGKHTVSVRGTLAGNNNTNIPASFPGQPASSIILNNSRGISALYTAVLNPSLVNVATFGLTRVGLQQTGPAGTGYTLDTIDPFVNYTRGYTRIAPTYNLIDDVTWTRGTHTVTAGANIRFVRNGITNYANAWPNYSSSRSSLTGLGSDILDSTTNFLRSLTGNSSIAPANSQAVTRALTDLFGVVTGGSMIYSYNHDGMPLAIGTPTKRNFATNEYAIYLSDSWRAKPGLTFTYGVRYEHPGAPWETSGLQVAPVFPLQDFYAERLGGAEAGIPSYQLPHAHEQYALNGPSNGKPSWWGGNANWSPHIAVAYSPTNSGGLIGKIVGKGGVIRAGGAIAYDRFGSDMIVQFDNNASFGLSEVDPLPSVTFSTPGSRFTGALPAPPPASNHTFPFKPANVALIGGTYMGIESNLKTPYAYVLNASLQRPLPGGLTLEVGYQGRFSHRLLMQIDVGGVAWNFKDPKSGFTLASLQKTMRDLYNGGLDPNKVKTSPGLVPLNQFAENEFPALKDHYFQGSASANYYYLLNGINAESDTDTLNQADRLTSVVPNCASVTGCWTFYTPQASGINTWAGVGTASYNGGTVTLRRPLSHGLSFDFNYTLSHSIDDGGGAESGRGTYGGIMLDPYDYRAYRGSSDFDARHNINANLLYELPVGAGKRFLGHAPRYLDEIVGGWQISTISRYRSGLPTSIFTSGIFPTNFSFGAIAYPIGPYQTNLSIDSKGNPGIFSNPAAAAANWLPMYAGSVGTRAAVRLDRLLNFDIAVAKSFRMPWEGHRLQFRAEAFNAFNTKNFVNPSLDSQSPATFGEFLNDMPQRVMQFALRYEF